MTSTFPGLGNIEQYLKQIIGGINGLNQTVVATNTAIAAQTTALSTAFPPPLVSSVTWNPPNLISGASESTTVTVTGAALGNYVQPSFSLDIHGLQLTGNVSAANTVTVVLSNLTGGAIDLASGILKVRVYN